MICFHMPELCAKGPWPRDAVEALVHLATGPSAPYVLYQGPRSRAKDKVSEAVSRHHGPGTTALVLRTVRLVTAPPPGSKVFGLRSSGTFHLTHV